MNDEHLVNSLMNKEARAMGCLFSIIIIISCIAIVFLVQWIKINWGV